MARGRNNNNYRRPDHYSQKAKAEGYAARSVYKLQEIQERTRILKPGQHVVDLGCFPGSWSKYALQQIGRKGRIVGVDLNEPELPGVWIVRSVFDVTTEELIEALDGQADVVLSDMAQKTMGTRMGDHYQQIELARFAMNLASQILKPGGSFVCKIFEGPDAQPLQQEARLLFKRVKRMRPDAVRKESREWFLVAQDFKGLKKSD